MLGCHRFWHMSLICCLIIQIEYIDVLCKLKYFAIWSLYYWYCLSPQCPICFFPTSIVIPENCFLLIGFQTCYDYPLGMENGLIPNFTITASSQLGPSWAAPHARLKYSGIMGAWIPARNDHNQWLQVDFERQTQVTGIATQGYYHALHYVKSYTLQFSNDGFSFKEYQPESRAKVKVCERPIFFDDRSFGGLARCREEESRHFSLKT